MLSAKSWVGWCGAGLALGVGAACAPAVSSSPLFNAAPEGPEQYFYGPAELGAAQKPTAAVVVPPKPEVAQAAVSAVKETKPKTPTVSIELEGDAGAAPDTKLALVGEFRGTDHVTIRLPGIPTNTEDDERARARVEVGEDGSYVVSVLDSNSGDELCGLSGKERNGRIDFDPGQPCFEDVLGFEADTSLNHGYAEVRDNTLTIRFVIGLTALDADVEGALDYQFDGKRQ